MDRVEAYNLLTEEMEKLAQLPPDRLTAMCGNVVETERHGTGGVLYSVALNVEGKMSEQFVIAGSIHDNSGYQFSLLEERMEKSFTVENRPRSVPPRK